VLQAVAQDSHVLLYRDIAMESLVRLAEQVAPSEASVLITGESGTGKEVLARLIHRRSRRARHNFISVNCAAIPENLLESELFGHEKGAFTGAIARRIGKFEEASGGTMLLDEVSEMHPRLQAKLLRAVQEREIDRVGGLQPIKIDIRLIATTNRDIEDAVRKGEFREDLYFRLNVVNLRIPALRERPRDIGMLAEHFLKKYAEANGLPLRPLTAAAQEILARHSWRGNVRELENTMHRAVLLAQGDEIGPEAVMLAPLRMSDDGAGTPSHGSQGMVGRTVADVERDLILGTLQHCLGNRTHAANILGISIRTLRNKLQLYRQEGMVVPHPGEPERASA
jgi:DNA-binding NtrC family response regulator